MITVIEGNLATEMLLLFGVIIGVFGGFAATNKKLMEDKPLVYTEAPITQTLNRLLFVVGCVVCFWVDFPEYSESPLRQFNWLFFPCLGFMLFLLCWCFSFWIIVALKAIIRWIFASFLIEI